MIDRLQAELRRMGYTNADGKALTRDALEQLTLATFGPRAKPLPVIPNPPREATP